MKANTLLKNLETLLHNEKIDCSLEKPSKQIPYSRLLIFIGHDQQNRERILEVTSQDQETLHPLQTGKLPLHYQRTQFCALIPFSIQEGTTPHVSSLLHFINHQIELPGFEMDELRSRLFFRYIMMTGQKKLDESLFLSVLGNIMMLLELYSNTIERVASGEITFDNLLEEILVLAKQV